MYAACHVGLCWLAKGLTHVQVVLGAPECLSYTFNADGKVTSFTGVHAPPLEFVRWSSFACMYFDREKAGAVRDGSGVRVGKDPW